MNLERELLRKSAGIHTELKEGSSSRIKTLDYEAELLKSFSMFLKDLKRIKNSIKNPYPGYGPGPYGMLKDEKGKPDLKRLNSIAKEKLMLVQKAIDDVFCIDSDDDDDEEGYDED